MSWLSSAWDSMFGSESINGQQATPANTTLQQARLSDYADNAGKVSLANLDNIRTMTQEDRARTQAISDNLISTADGGAGMNQEVYDRWKNNYWGAEDQQLQEARGYASAENKERMRGRAISGVAQTTEAARQNAMKNLESYGINPGSVRYAGLDTGVRASAAAAMAAAGNQSDLTTEATGRALLDQAVKTGQTSAGVGQGFANTKTAATNAKTNALNTAGNLPLATTANTSNVTGTPLDWNKQATGAITNSGELAIGQAKTDIGAAEVNQDYDSGFGTVVGTAAKMIAMGAKDGGAIPDPTNPSAFAGHVPRSASPSGGDGVDDVNARLTAGEFVVPADVTAWFGQKHFQNLIKQARTHMGGDDIARPRAIQTGAA